MTNTASKTPTTEKTTARKLHGAAACACGKRHGHVVIETVKRTYVGVRCERIISTRDGAIRASACQCGRVLQWRAA